MRDHNDDGSVVMGAITGLAFMGAVYAVYAMALFVVHLVR